MFPWIWWWAPRVEFPLSGNVVQDIEPSMPWFFGSIAPSAGDGRIEAKAFQVASYGRQLGLLTDLVIELSERSLPQDAEGRRALDELRRIRNEISAIKETEHEAADLRLEAQLREVVQRGGPRASRVAGQLRPLIDGR